MQEGEEGLAGQQRVTMVMRNGRWMGARGANTAGTGASHDQQMTEQRLMEGLAGVPGLQQGLQRVQARVSVFSEDTESACALKRRLLCREFQGCKVSIWEVRGVQAG